MKFISGIALFALGIAAGAIGAGLWSGSDEQARPDEWLARAGDQYLTRAEFEDAMRRRGGADQYHDREMRSALLDRLLFDRALVQRAIEAGIHREPEVRRSRDQILINRVIQNDLRPRQQAIEIESAAIEAFYAEQAGEYTIPARRRVAMLFFELGENASDETRQEVVERTEAAQAEARALDTPARDFGSLAREYSDHQASRYRGGVLGWVSEGEPGRYSYPEVVLQTASALAEPGDISEVVADENGLYLVRLVDHEPRRERTLEELEAGIRQRLLRERHVEVEQAFREDTLASVDIEIRDDALDRVVPPGDPRERSDDRTPPALPATASRGGAR